MSSAIPEPPKPYPGLSFRAWGVSLWTWLVRHVRVYPGAGLRETSTNQGRVFAVVSPDPYIGEIKLMAGDMIGPDAGKWLLCDGTEYSVTDYPQLFASIGDTWGGDGTTTFAVPPAGVFPVFSGQSPNYARDEIEYTVGDSGGYNKHGQTENNHFDHSVKVDLYHTHPVPITDQEICIGPSTGGVCDIGAVTVPAYTANLDTGGPEAWGTGDQVPATGAPDASQGSISKTGDELTVTLKHGGYSVPDSNTGSFVNDTDNRPTFAAFAAYIRALP